MNSGKYPDLALRESGNPFCSMDRERELFGGSAPGRKDGDQAPPYVADRREDGEREATVFWMKVADRLMQLH